MYSIVTAFQNSVGRKILTGVTGIGLTLFLITHLSANLTLFALDPSNIDPDNAFNRYALFLKDLGWLLYIVEFGLLAIFLIHAYLGVAIYLRKRKARPEAYEKYKTRGGPSKQGYSARTMIITGTILFLFVGMHLKTFKFGPGWNEEAAYTTIIVQDGADVPMRDLSKLTIEIFQDPIYVVVYMSVMLLLGFHLRHGIWSALQSLGANNKKLTPLLYTVAGVIGILIALGFFVLPIWLYIMF